MGTAREENVDKVNYEPEIKVTKNGPYVVSGKLPISEQIIIVNKEGVPVEWGPGKKYPLQEKCGLCRCGGSNNKPFCDGTHGKNGFTDKKLTDGSLNQRNNYVGKKITIHDNRGICAHAGFCTDNLASVFSLKQEPWINP